MATPPAGASTLVSLTCTTYPNAVITLVARKGEGIQKGCTVTYLYAIRPGEADGLEVQRLSGISRETEEGWLDALDFVATVEQGTFRYVERNYATFKHAVQRMGLAARSIYSRQMGEAVIETTGSAMDWLGSFRSYIDYMSRSSTGDSRSRFKDRCSTEYDDSFSYRFTWHLRNYAQHCGIPLHTIRQPDGDCLLNRDTLLKNYEWKKSLREEMLRGPIRISLVTAIDETMTSLRTINSWVIGEITPYLVESLKQAREFREYFARSYDGWFPVSSETGLTNLAPGQFISIDALPLWAIEVVEQMIE